MKRIFSFLFAIITLVGTTGVFTSCQEDAPEINYTINITVNNDFTEVVNAINNGTMKQEAAIAALTAAINQMNGDQAAKLQALIEAINTLATTLDAKLAIIEAAMKAQTLALESKLSLLTSAVKSQTIKQEELAKLLSTAIDNLSGTLEDKLAAIEAIIESTSATLADKLAAVEAAMKAQTLSLENKLALLEAAIKALPDYTDQLKAIEAAIKGMPDYSDKLAAIETAIKNIPDYSDKLAALETALEAIAENIEDQEGQYADELAALTESIDAIKSEVAAGNKSQDEALAEIIALLESGAIAGGGGGGGSGGEGEGGEGSDGEGEGGEGSGDEPTGPYILLTTERPAGNTIQFACNTEPKSISGAVDLRKIGTSGGYPLYEATLTSQEVKVYGTFIEFHCENMNLTKINTDTQGSLQRIIFQNNPDLECNFKFNTQLEYINLLGVDISKSEMDELVKSLPNRKDTEGGDFWVDYDVSDDFDDDAAKKGWDIIHKY